MRYILNFGSENTLGNPIFAVFEDATTHVALARPPIYENPSIPGQYYFDVYWAGVDAAVTTISYTAEVNASLLSADIDRPAIDTSASGMMTALAGASGQNLTLYPTAKTVINRAATQCSQAAVVDPFAETNPDYVVFCDLLTSLSRDLMNAAEEGWTHLIQTATFTTDGVSTGYALPAGFRMMVDNTLWDRSMRLPGIGPITPQQRAALQARLVSIVLNVTWRLEGNIMTFPIVPPSGHTVAFDFHSINWVCSSGSPVPDKDRATASTDILLFDEELLVSGLALRWLENRGFDTTKAQERFNRHLESAIGRNSAGSVISLGGNPRLNFDRMISVGNIQDGGWPA